VQAASHPYIAGIHKEKSNAPIVVRRGRRGVNLRVKHAWRKSRQSAPLQWW
jgi:hypothetical protein